MKQLKSLFPILGFLAITITSCNKNNAVGKTPEELLSAHSWQPDELRTLVNNAPFYYKRGSSSNSTEYNLDSESILFKADKTGTYSGADGKQYAFTWNFSNAEKTKLTWIVQFTPVTTINWEIVSLTDSKIVYNEYYTRNGIATQTYGDRIPK
jgi:hypothetical protein